MIYSFSGSIPRNATKSAERITLACFDWFCKVAGSFIDLFVYQFESHGSLQSFQQQEFNLTSCPGSGEGVGVCVGEEDAESEAGSPEGILTSSIQQLEIKHSAIPPLPVSLAISDQQPAWPTPPYIFNLFRSGQARMLFFSFFLVTAGLLLAAIQLPCFYSHNSTLMSVFWMITWI